MENKKHHIRLTVFVMLFSFCSWAQQPMYEVKGGIGLKTAIPYQNTQSTNSKDNHALETNLKLQVELLLQKRIAEKLFIQAGYAYCGSGYQYNFTYEDNQNFAINTYKLYISSNKVLLRLGYALTPRIQSILGANVNFHQYTLTEFYSHSTGPDSLNSRFTLYSPTKNFTSISNTIGLNFLVSKRINFLVQAEIDWGKFPSFDLTTNLSSKSSFNQRYSYSSEPKFLFLSVGCYYSLYRSKY